MITRERVLERLPILRLFDFSVIKAEKGHAVVEVKHSDVMEREGGFVFGGIIAMFFDAVLGLAVLTVNDVGDQATVSLSVEFLRKARDESYIFEGKVTKKGRNLVFVEGEMKGKEGSKVFARAYGVWMLLS